MSEDPKVLLPSVMSPEFASSPDDITRMSQVVALSDAMAKAYEPVSKALSPPPSAFSFATMSYMPDPQAGGLMSWPDLPPESLQKLARTNIAPEMIISTRVADVLRYSNLSTHPWKPGWRIELRDRSKHPSTWERRDMRRCEAFISNCNNEIEDGDARTRDGKGYNSFKQFLAKSVRDFLTYDSIAIWTDTDRAGRVKGFAALPAGNIRLADPNVGYLGNLNDFAVMIDQGGSVIKTFTRKDLIWYVGNPRVDPDMAGYGMSRVSVGMKEIGGFQDALELNFQRFQVNATPMGMLLLKGAGWTQCFSEDTEVLTKDGWKFFSEVDIDKDTFATLDTETKALSYEKAFARVWQDYEGEMYRVHGRQLDMLVSPEHTVLFEAGDMDTRRTVKRMTARELYDSGRWNNARRLFVPLDAEYVQGESRHTIDWYRKSGAEDREYRCVRDEALECEPQKANAYLAQFMLNKNGLRGHVMQLPDSEEVDRVMILALHAGRSAAHAPGVNDRNQQLHPWRTIIRKKPRAPFRMEKVNYSGKIGCVSLEKNKTLYVRRNGKPGWSGNTELDVIARQFANLKRGVSKTWALPAMVVPGASEVEFMDMSAITGHDIQYQNHMNLVMGIFCTVYQFPHRRMGFRISGAGPDAEPISAQTKDVSPTDEEDIGLITLLNHYEEVLNEYLIWTRWPHLQLVFTGKAPREDAREYEAKQMARTWGESRAEADLPPLEELVEDEEMKVFAKLLSLTPVDAAKAATFQNLATKFLAPQGAQGTPQTDQPMFAPSKDPAQAQDHGAVAGVRRHSGNKQ